MGWESKGIVPNGMELLRGAAVPEQVPAFPHSALARAIRQMKEAQMEGKHGQQPEPGPPRLLPESVHGNIAVAACRAILA